MTGQDLVGLLPLVLIFAVFYLLFIRPQRNRQRQTLAMQRQLTVGQEVVTASGLYGTIVGLDEDTVSLEISPGVVSRWARGAVARVVAGESADAVPEERPDTVHREDDEGSPAGA